MRQEANRKMALQICEFGDNNSTTESKWIACKYQDSKHLRPLPYNPPVDTNENNPCRPNFILWPSG